MEAAYFAHETAVVDDEAFIGPGCRIWHFSHVMPGAQLGEACNLGQNVYIGKHVQLGKQVKIQNNVSVYTGVTCEDEVFLGPSAVFTNILNPRSGVSRQEELESTLVKHGATIGANATVICGITIGTYAFVGAGAVVTRDVPAYALYLGNPARHSGWMSARGHRLTFDHSDRAVCPESGQLYERTTEGVKPVQSL